MRGGGRKKKLQRLYRWNGGGSTHGGHMEMKKGNVGLRLYNTLAVGT